MRWCSFQTILVLGLVVPTALSAQPAPNPSATTAPPATPAPAGAKLYFISPKNGDQVRSPFVAQFGLSGMGVTQAGNAVANAGHHHVLIDVTEPLDPADIIPADKNHLHFGGGQTETRLDLPPGRHTLQLVLGDANHRPFQPVVLSDKITVTVQGATTRRKVRRLRRYRDY